MDRAELETKVLGRLQRESRSDPMRWVPLIGSADQHGAACGLAIELLGATPTRRDVDRLVRLLFRLAHEGAVEVAEFKSAAVDGRPFDERPTRHDDQTHLAFAVSHTASRFARYGVRLRRHP